MPIQQLMPWGLCIQFMLAFLSSWFSVHVHQAVQDIINHVRDCGNHWGVPDDAKKLAFQSLDVKSKTKYVAGTTPQIAPKEELQSVKLQSVKQEDLPEHEKPIVQDTWTGDNWTRQTRDYSPEEEEDNDHDNAADASANVRTPPESPPAPAQPPTPPRPPPRQSPELAGAPAEVAEPPDPLYPASGALIAQLLANAISSFHFAIASS
jgi:hypothetical protein